MHWFKTIAPIRLKLLVAFGSLTALNIIVVVAGLIAGDLFTVIAGSCVMIAQGLLGALYREQIANPYVTTVVRMEALAAGDLDSQIQFTEYEDCVGRLTKAMFTFRDAAVAQNRHGEVRHFLN